MEPQSQQATACISIRIEAGPHLTDVCLERSIPIDGDEGIDEERLGELLGLVVRSLWTTDKVLPEPLLRRMVLSAGVHGSDRPWVDLARWSSRAWMCDIEDLASHIRVVPSDTLRAAWESVRQESDEPAAPTE